LRAISADLDDDLALALALADTADALTLRRFRAADLHVQTKPDDTPVSEADHAVETAVRDRLAVDRPGDAIIGEEFGVSGAGRRRWIIDPIDGTKSFVRGVPAWATLLALEVDDEVVVGVASAPALRRRWWARTGGGAFANGDPIHVSTVARLADAHVCAPSVRAFERAGLDAGFRSLIRGSGHVSGFADFWGHVLVAEGAADVMVEPTLARWDVAALQPIVAEAGGRLSDFRGAPWADDAPCLTTNGSLHQAAVDALAGTP